jgi:hypothetical protein
MANLNRINTDLKRLPITTFHEDPKNARRHPSRNLDAIKNSLAAFGQQKPIIVDSKTNTIIAGNGTYRAAKALGWTEIGFSYYDGPAGKMRNFAAADNRTAELAEWDTAMLAQQGFSAEDWDEAGWTPEERRDQLGGLPSSTAPAADAAPGGTLSNEGAETGLTPQEKIDTFLNNTLRQIVLIYKSEDHARALEGLERVCREQGLDSNTDAVDWLLAQYAAAQAG